jgi:hypothetical protein
MGDVMKNGVYAPGNNIGWHARDGSDFPASSSWSPVCIELENLMPFDEQVAFISKQLFEEVDCRV